MKNVLCVVLLILVLPINAKTRTETAGDILQVALPLTGLGVAWWKGDDEGLEQQIKGALITGAITHGLKFAIEEQRPNGKNWDSFPSGHTSAAFSGAAFLHHRYGIEYGLPAYVAASYVGYSRCYASKHWETDVLAGAVLAYTVSYYVTTEYNDPNLTVASARFGNSDAQGILFSYSI
ncbi:PAP2 family protein [Photobacterium rosenbergii]|uniref:undecaprenyl-diphosphate phosphatase n=1 Tax=Photobacterium rosenbergii TaxID=294936 RepID=A0A2T3NKN4_9GAMM|nr:phosphatase PAP2 family protein [Photobacterium rosenbergii]PSW16077.1 PAP2 family protein [Photobacterium rosenbergii]